MDIDGMLSRKINLPDIKSMAHWASGDADHMATFVVSGVFCRPAYVCECAMGYDTSV